MEKTITIDKSKCIHCGLCIKDCIMHSLEFDAEKIPQYGPKGQEKCLSCQHCLAVCPSGALSFGGLNPEDSDKAGYGNSSELLNLIRSRRSIRHYNPQDVPADFFEKIKAMLPFVPTGGNVEALYFSIIESKAKMEHIRKVTEEKILDHISGASPLAQLMESSIKHNDDIIYRNAPALIAVAVNDKKILPSCKEADPIIALSYVDLYAQSLGLGTLWCGMAVKAAQDIPEVRACLEIPEGYSLKYIMLLGLPAIKYQRTIQPEACIVNEIK